MQEILRSLGLEEHILLFKENQVGCKEAITLTDSKFSALGIVQIGDRARIRQKCKESISGIPFCVQMDRGAENTLIEDIQTAFHEVYADHQQTPCVIHSVSPHNQRIEHFWRTLFDMMINFWVDHLRELAQDGLLDCTSSLHVQCLRFCFMPMIQAELDEFRMEWNQHRTRAIAHTDALHGKPDLMYFVPEILGAHNFRIPVPMCEITTIKEQFTTAPRSSGCSAEFEASCQDILLVHNKEMPSSYDEGVELFNLLLNEMEP